VQENSQIMVVVAQVGRLFFIEPEFLANGGVFGIGDIIFIDLFQSLTDIDPGFRPGVSDVGQFVYFLV
jgi:hypothetical protein